MSKPEVSHAGHRSRVRSVMTPKRVEEMKPHQLLEFLLFYTVKQQDTNEQAHRLLDGFSCIGEVFISSVDDLCKKGGLSESAAVFIKLIYDIYEKYGGFLCDGLLVVSNPLMVDIYLRKIFEVMGKDRIFGLVADGRDRILAAGFMKKQLSDAGITAELDAFLKPYGDGCRVFAAKFYDSPDIENDEVQRASKLMDSLRRPGDFYFVTDEGFAPLSEVVRVRNAGGSLWL